MIQKYRTSEKGFTLIELMIVVAIIGILAAIAIPNFMRFQLKSKSSEGKVNLAAIRTAEEGYMAEFGAYVAAAETTMGTSAKVDFGTCSGDPVVCTTADFDTLGWAPNGPVQATYQVEVLGGSTDFIVHGWIDADDDGVPAHFTITKSSQPVRVTPKSVR